MEYSKGLSGALACITVKVSSRPTSLSVPSCFLAQLPPMKGVHVYHLRMQARPGVLERDERSPLGVVASCAALGHLT